MRRPTLLLLGWALVTVVSTLAAWRAVSFVASNVTPRASTPVAVADLEAQPADGPETPPSPDSTVAPAGASPGQEGPVAAPLPAPAAGARAPSPAGATTAQAGTAAPPPPPAPAQTAPPATGAETATTAPPTTASPAATTETRTVPSVGGTAAFEFGAGTVELLWARPEPGFTATVLRREADRVEVEFRSDTHTSRVRARWLDGPVTDVNESGG